MARTVVLALLLLPLTRSGGGAQDIESGFTALFDGRSLQGFVPAGVVGRGFVVEDGLLVCPSDGGGNLFTAAEYSDFILRFQFRLTAGANNGVGIRAPLDGDAAYLGMEVQILDDDAPAHAALKPWQYHGSVYGIAAARRGALRPAGEWNDEEIEARGRRIRVAVNGKTVVDTDLNDVRNVAILRKHPGLLRDRGRIGFLGHGTTVAFRRIRIRDLSQAAPEPGPPPGFRLLFNGRDLAGFRGLSGDPPALAKLDAAERAKRQKAADRGMGEHWSVRGGILHYDGKGTSLCTTEDFGDFELLVDWRIRAGGDSGIYLRGCPQVQIWDRPEGSGGLYNNKKNASTPSKRADRPPGEWNRFRILMLGDRVTVFLNGELVVHDVAMENYWDRSAPLPARGAIELQHHGNPLEFRNLHVRSLDPPR